MTREVRAGVWVMKDSLPSLPSPSGFGTELEPRGLRTGGRRRLSLIAGKLRRSAALAAP